MSSGEMVFSDARPNTLGVNICEIYTGQRFISQVHSNVYLCKIIRLDFVLYINLNVSYVTVEKNE